jgi:hypothetical protein
MLCFCIDEVIWKFKSYRFENTESKWIFWHIKQSQMNKIQLHSFISRRAIVFWYKVCVPPRSYEKVMIFSRKTINYRKLAMCRETASVHRLALGKVLKILSVWKTKVCESRATAHVCHGCSSDPGNNFQKQKKSPPGTTTPLRGTTARLSAATRTRPSPPPPYGSRHVKGGWSGTTTTRKPPPPLLLSLRCGAAGLVHPAAVEECGRRHGGASHYRGGRWRPLWRWEVDAAVACRPAATTTTPSLVHAYVRRLKHVSNFDPQAYWFIVSFFPSSMDPRYWIHETCAMQVFNLIRRKTLSFERLFCI